MIGWVSKKYITISYFFDFRIDEHSAAISNICLEDEELITDDYDGVILARSFKHHSKLKDMFTQRSTEKS